MWFIEWFFSLFLKKKVRQLKLETAAENAKIAQEYTQAKERYRQKFLKPKRYRKAPTINQ